MIQSHATENDPHLLYSRSQIRATATAGLQLMLDIFTGNATDFNSTQVSSSHRQ